MKTYEIIQCKCMNFQYSAFAFAIIANGANKYS